MILIGDIHGSFRAIDTLAHNTLENVIIQVGDFGLGFHSLEHTIKQMEALNTTLVAQRKTLYVIRGNHDNPKFWDGTYDGRWSNLHLVKDYEVILIEGQKVLFIGGALSIDRASRTAGMDYWLAETFDYDEEKLTEVLNLHDGVDIVVTHSAPSFCYPRHFNRLVHSFAENDPTLLDELTAERVLIDRAYDVICHKSRPSHWVYGHFHNDVSEEVDGTKFILLGIASTVNI